MATSSKSPKKPRAKVKVATPRISATIPLAVSVKPSGLIVSAGKPIVPDQIGTSGGAVNQLKLVTNATIDSGDFIGKSPVGMGAQIKATLSKDFPGGFSGSLEAGASVNHMWRTPNGHIVLTTISKSVSTDHSSNTTKASIEYGSGDSKMSFAKLYGLDYSYNAATKTNSVDVSVDHVSFTATEGQKGKTFLVQVKIPF